MKLPMSPHRAVLAARAAAKQRGLNLFARIGHAAAAQRVGRTLRPTELPIFGKPQGGTPFGLAIDRRGHALLSEAFGGAAGTGTLASCACGRDSAQPLRISAAVPEGPSAACRSRPMAATPNGLAAH